MGGHSKQYTKNVLVILSMNSKFFKYKLSCFPIPPKMQVLFIKKHIMILSKAIAACKTASS